jgi:hypothetical protein
VLDHLEPAQHLMSQMVYHHLIVQLHLPYILSPGPRTDGRGDTITTTTTTTTTTTHDYSRLAVANASREILVRFVAFRTAYPVGACCRGVDVLAFVASTALCLVMLEAHRRRARGAAAATAGVLDILRHARLDDRGVLLRAAACMRRMSTGGGAGGAGADAPMARDMAAVLDSLLEVELEAHCGVGLGAVPPVSLELGPAAEGADGERVGAVSGGGVVRINVPYLGTVTVRRDGMSRAPGTVVARGPAAAVVGGGAGVGLVISPEMPAVNCDAAAWPLQGVDSAFFDSVFWGLEEG